MNNKLIPVTLLTGYLGSGKTTLLNNILKRADGRKIAVIVNDIGEVNIDAELIEKGGIATAKDENLVPLQNGCICCTLKMDLIEQISELVNLNKFDHIVIEASGICEPIPIAQTLTMLTDALKNYKLSDIVKLDAIVSVVDTLRIAREFGCGEELVKDNIDEEDIENLIIQQIEFCDVIILNKVSDVTEEELNKVRAIIKRLQPNAKVIETDYSNVDMNDILDTNLFDFEASSLSAGWIEALENPEEEEEGETEEYGISTFVYYNRKPFNREKFIKYIETLPRNIIRSKGVVYFEDQKEMSYMYEQAGTSKNVVETGLWIAEAPIEEIERIKALNPDLARDWDDKYGDRMVKIVFIGQNMDKEEIVSQLDSFTSNIFI